MRGGAILTNQKHVLITILIFIELLLITCAYVSYGNKNLDKYIFFASNSDNKTSNMLSMLLETEYGSGEYENSTRDSWPTSGYIYNKEKSGCTYGSLLTWNSTDKTIIVTGNRTDECFIYFNNNFKLSLDNYTFSWNEIEDASSYQIYSNGILLTTTSDTNAEIWKLYDDAGTYNINVKAIDSNSDKLVASNSVAYKLEQLNLNLSGEYIRKASNYKAQDLGDPDYPIYTLYMDHLKELEYEDPNLNIVSLTNNNYNINLAFAYMGAFTDSVISYTEGYNVALLQSYENFAKKNMCWLYNICNTSELANLSYNSTIYKFYYDSASNYLILDPLNGSGEWITILFQFYVDGKVPTDWYYTSFVIYCLSSNTEVYVYDKKKNKFKKKKIGDIDYDDEILCWDFDKGDFAKAKPIWIKKSERTSKYNLLKFSDGSLLETINQHRIFNVEKGKFTYPMTDDTPIGTTTFNSKGEYVKLISKEVVEKSIEYYNVITEYHMNLFANDILTSCRLNNIYKIENMKYIYDKKRDNGYDFSEYDENIVEGLRLKEQNIEESKLKSYINGMIRMMKK